MLVDFGGRAGAEICSKLVKMIDVLAVASTQEVVLTSAIHTSTANAGPGLLGLFRAEFVLQPLRQFRPERPLSNGVDLVPFVLVFEVHFVGIVQNVVLSGTSAIGHGLHVADRAQGLTGT